jgi:hypothetical protein
LLSCASHQIGQQLLAALEQQPDNALSADLLDACSRFTAADWSQCLMQHLQQQQQQQQRCTPQSLLQLLQQALPLTSAAQLADFVIFEALELLIRQHCCSSSSSSSGGDSSTSSSSSSIAMGILRLCRAAAFQPGSRLQAVSSIAELRNMILALKLRDAEARIGAEAEFVLMETCVAAMAAAV